MSMGPDSFPVPGGSTHFSESPAQEALRSTNELAEIIASAGAPALGEHAPTGPIFRAAVTGLISQMKKERGQQLDTVETH